MFVFICSTFRNTPTRIDFICLFYLITSKYLLTGSYRVCDPSSDGHMAILCLTMSRLLSTFYELQYNVKKMIGKASFRKTYFRLVGGWNHSRLALRASILTRHPGTLKRRLLHHERRGAALCLSGIASLFPIAHGVKAL